MSTFTRVTSVSVLAGALLLGVTMAPASAGSPPRLQVAKHLEGPYRPGQGVNVDPGQKKTLYLKARSGTNELETGNLQETASLNSSYQVKYFKGDNNISHDVQTAGHAFNLKPTAKRFRVTIKGISGPAAPDCLEVTLEQGAGGSDTIVVAVNGAVCLL